MQMIPCLRSPDESYSILTIDKINSMPAAGHADGSEGVKFNIVMKFDSEKLSYQEFPHCLAFHWTDCVV